MVLNRRLKRTSQTRQGRVYTAVRLKADNRRAVERLLEDDPHFSTLSEALEWLLEEGRRATGDSGEMPSAEARGFELGIRKAERKAMAAIHSVLKSLK